MLDCPSVIARMYSLAANMLNKRLTVASTQARRLCAAAAHLGWLDLGAFE